MTFEEFLFSVGYNETGVKEIITRINENRADREDLYYYRRWKEEQH